MNLLNYFTKPSNPRQRQYEAVRAVIVDKQSIKIAARKFGYTKSTLYSLLRDVKANKLALFPHMALGQTKRRTPDYIQNEIIKKRNQNMSAKEIGNELGNENFKIDRWRNGNQINNGTNKDDCLFSIQFGIINDPTD